jgi:hypothetical protein
MGIFSISAGLILGAGVWTFVKGGIAALRSLAKRTKTTTDDKLVDKLDGITKHLEEHPELIEALHQLVQAVRR